VSNDDYMAPADHRDHGLPSRGEGLRPLVEILYFDGCPNHAPVVSLVERLSRELDLNRQLLLVNVPDDETARRLRFLGSATIRVGGRDVDPDAAERRDYGLSCRIFRTAAGMVGQPDELWIREALLRDASDDRRPAQPCR
jgi:hypothetical protein